MPGIGVGIYTIITIPIVCASIYSAYQAGIQTAIIRDNFVTDERAYIFAGTFTNTICFKEGEKTRIDINFINFGKTPSQKEIEQIHFWTDKDSAIEMRDFFAKTSTKPSDHGLFIVFPNIGAKPGDVNFKYATIFAETPLTGDDHQRLSAVDGAAIVAGRIGYDDIFGESHWSDFCRYTLATGAISDCPEHNEIH